jgi:hypothetical protein
MTITDQPPGMVAAMASSDAGRYPTFFANINALELPTGTEKAIKIGDRVEMLNDLTAQMLASDAYWIWFIGDAHSFAPGIVSDLLSRNAPIVAPLSVSAEAPHLPLVWDEAGTTMKLNEVIGPTSIIEVGGAILDGMLVRRAVFEEIAKDRSPFFYDVIEEMSSEDAVFCNRARKSGFDIRLDTSSRLSSLILSSVTPHSNGHTWSLDVRVGDVLKFDAPVRHK